ncbi:beta-ketoacyl-[acyl-carrier-protein] synthase family protein [Photobacterium atrarenae]|uniref:Beta-ketoacyl-[acyl-carrier-protein] synthase family protein n=1 Tax=Photobacterium atrarenae TaxID=865757 RepID=A0ABY5GMC4_9GAMM|nr:beta-ketoacyl-[acyl-carrier-protein] synthase family protein [Photobacterium atrarenae]UTV30407.1 beta-ketoacyl-[acyl-carrier-protein] synthase family protein [Photobacterium atrarenae]
MKTILQHSATAGNHATSAPVYIHACASHSALGLTRNQIRQRLADGFSPDMAIVSDQLNTGMETVVGKACGDRPRMPARLQAYDSGNNRLALSVLTAIEAEVQQAIEIYGADRVAVIAGTSTSGIADTEAALAARQDAGDFPSSYDYRTHEAGNISAFVAKYFGTHGPAYTISTACSSSGRVFLTARRLLRSGMADAVIVGGADSLCQLTLNGFHGLEAMSDGLCNPFSENRKGINIGEAAAFMLLSLDRQGATEYPVALLGAGDSSDAHHISAPHPEGRGAEEAMRKALADAGLSPEQIGYLNAHGTATPLNDAMEAGAIHRVFGVQVPVSSTKPLTGHTLGAASSVEAAICWQILHEQLPLPVQVNDGIHGASLAPITLVKPGMALEQPAVMSNSFAFGGNNISLIFGYPYEK